LKYQFNLIPISRVAEGWFRQVMSEIPVGGPTMELKGLVGVVPLQFFAQEVGKEPMITEPLSVIVQGQEEQILSLQGFQHRLPIFLAGDGVA
jgi:hypothetical protein